MRRAKFFLQAKDHCCVGVIRDAGALLQQVLVVANPRTPDVDVVITRTGSERERYPA
jgi:hypothetical protein